jgi:hypothetical protein
MHLLDLAAVTADENPVVPCFVEIADGGNLGAWEARERVKGRDVVQREEKPVPEPDADKGDG